MPNHPSVNRSFSWLDLPEWNVGVFSFLLNFVWELQQMPFFKLSPELSCLGVIRNCTLATVGDIGISMTAFWAVAALSKSRQWFHQPSRWQTGSFILVGVVITVIFEVFSTGLLNLWEYAAIMPTLPFLGTGLLPVFQWILIPPLIIWFVKRQLSDTRQKPSRQV